MLYRRDCRRFDLVDGATQTAQARDSVDPPHERDDDEGEDEGGERKQGEAAGLPEIAVLEGDQRDDAEDERADERVDSAFCDTSSETTSANERGVAVLPADAYAETIDATAKAAMTSMLPDMMVSSVSMDWRLISGTNPPAPVWSATFARKAPAIDRTYTRRGRTQSRSLIRLIKNLSRSGISRVPGFTNESVLVQPPGPDPGLPVKSERNHQDTAHQAERARFVGVCLAGRGTWWRREGFSGRGRLELAAPVAGARTVYVARAPEFH